MTPFSISSITNNLFSKKEIDMKGTSLIHDVYTQTMLMARHQGIAKLFEEEFGVTR